MVLREIQLGSSTNLSGYYAIPQVPAGTYTLVCSYIGYQTHTRQVQLQPGTAQHLDIRLETQILEVGEVVISAAAESAERGFDQPLSKLELAPDQMARLPRVVEVDLLRSLQTLPGIVPVSDYSSAPHIRGGTPDQNLYLIDGTDVYNPEHAFGLFSIFNMDAIKSIQLYKGGFGARYGGRLSSILDVTHLDGNKEKFEGTAALSLLSARTTVQVPIRERGSVSGSLRRTYFDQTVGRLIDDIPQYYFYDGHLKAFVEINPRNKLTLSAYGGRDVLDLPFNSNASEVLDFQYRWGNTTGSMRWTTLLSPRLFANFWLTGSRFDSRFDLSETLGLKEKNNVRDLTAKGNFEYYHSDHWRSEFGFEQKNLRVVYQQDFSDARADIDKSATHYAGYGQFTYGPNPLWEIEAGLRANRFDSGTTQTDLAPRLAARYRLSDRATLKAAGGQYYQYLHRIPRIFIADIWTAANRFQRASASNHYILGYQQELSPHYQLEVETYHKTYRSIYSFNRTFIATIEPDFYADEVPIFAETRSLFNEGDGSSRGLEVLLQKRQGTIDGWIGYTLARTRYEIAAINRGTGFSPRHDRTSTLNLVGNLDIKNLRRGWTSRRARSDKNKWVFGFTFVYSSGQPITRPGSGYLAQSLPDVVGIRDYLRNSRRDFAVLPEQINRFRLPPYIRLDLSLRYERPGAVFFLDVFNAGNRKNVWFIQYDDDSEGFFVVQDIEKFPMFPILPSLGAQVKF